MTDACFNIFMSTEILPSNRLQCRIRLVRSDIVSSDVSDPAARAIAIQNVTNLLIHTFSSQFVFPVLGHDDPGAIRGQKITYTDLGNYWRQWLPTDAIQTFNKGQ